MKPRGRRGGRHGGAREIELEQFAAVQRAHRRARAKVRAQTEDERLELIREKRRIADVYTAWYRVHFPGRIR